ncbi:hypothetical protein QA644_10125 [Rhizobium sp. CC1099]|uniref:hypothetical protein n=1 Tax=Rhizobium sp. CC1099 TaxID=3039160 RepID=UPI0024B242DF|nr:hypothetical protein [Rhizobium sp. CC1099]WFU89359.1 hypothetical protein QA644_10125 [Rhizobium sp. CC1099]
MHDRDEGWLIARDLAGRKIEARRNCDLLVPSLLARHGRNSALDAVAIAVEANDERS